MINLIILFLILYLVYFFIYRAYLLFNFTDARIKEVKNKNNLARYYQDINVVIYSHDNSQSVCKLVELLKKQNYPQENYKLHVILDNCTDDSAKRLEILGGTKIWRIVTDEKPMGRERSYDWLIKRVLTSENTNAYVFIDSNYIVDTNFLNAVNTQTMNYPIINATIVPNPADDGIFFNISSTAHNLQLNLLNYGRKHTKFSDVLNTYCFAITQELVEKINFNFKENRYSAIEYTLKLIKEGYKIVSSKDLIIFKPTTTTFSGLAYTQSKYIKSNLKNFFKKFSTLVLDMNLITKESILSQIYPDETTLIMVALGLLAFSKTFMIGGFAPLAEFVSVVSLILSFCICAASQLKFTQYLNILGYILVKPLIWSSVLLLEPQDGLYSRDNKEIKVIEKEKLDLVCINETRHVNVITPKQKEVDCTLKIETKRKAVKIIFTYNGKELASAKQSRYDYALEEINEKLRFHGFTLKVCANCGYFKENTESVTKEDGFCLYPLERGQALEHTRIWACCDKLTPSSSRDFIHTKFGQAD